MRIPLPLTFVLVALLAGCATQKEVPFRKVAQDGNLRVHPGLLGQPVPPELQQPNDMAQLGRNGMAIDEQGLRTQRSVYFDFGRADLKADYEPGLRAHARYLAAHPKARVRVEGHADERGSGDFNLRLGKQRAETVRAALIGHGADKRQVAVRSLGETKPKLTGHNEEAWAENRRADVIYDKED